MARPCSPRRIQCQPEALYFKPRGIPLVDLQEVVIKMDELEAVRLADSEDLYHDKAAQHMGVSRPTFGRIVESARKKITDALVNGKALRIENPVQRPEKRKQADFSRAESRSNHRGSSCRSVKIPI